MMNCSGNCHQGRRPCPHPEDCSQFDGVPLREVICSLLWPLVLIAGMAIGAALYRVFA